MHIKALLFIFILSLSSIVMAGDPVAGKQLTANCIECHGDHGSPAKEGVPKIDRMISDTFLRVMYEMREAHHDLPIIAHALTDQEIEDIAAYLTYGE